MTRTYRSPRNKLPFHLRIARQIVVASDYKGNELFEEFYKTFDDLAIQYGFDAMRDKAQYDFLHKQVEKQIDGMVKSRAEKKAKEEEARKAKEKKARVLNPPEAKQSPVTAPALAPKKFGARRLRRCTRTADMF